MGKFLIAILTFCLAGCGPRYMDEYSAFNCQECCGPRLVFFPVAASCEYFPGTWNLGRELTVGIRDKLISSKAVCLYDQELLSDCLGTLPACGGASLEYMVDSLSPNFANGDFASFVDIFDYRIEHFDYPKVTPWNPDECYPHGWIVVIKVRIIIMDLRHCHTIIADEILTSTQVIRPDECFNYRTVCWGSMEYTHSPLYKAHEKLAREIADKIELLANKWW